MPHVERLIVDKSVSIQNSEEKWCRTRYTLEANVSDMESEQDLETFKEQLEKKVDDWLRREQGIEPNQTSVKNPKKQDELDFNPNLLLKHEWKGRKTGDGEWEAGSLEWGWDFLDNLPDSVVNRLREGSITIQNHVFTATDQIVQVQKQE